MLGEVGSQRMGRELERKRMVDGVGDDGGIVGV